MSDISETAKGMIGRFDLAIRQEMAYPTLGARIPLPKELEEYIASLEKDRERLDRIRLECEKKQTCLSFEMRVIDIIDS